MKVHPWILMISLAYLLQGFKSFPTDDWSIIYMWIGLGGACFYVYNNRKLINEQLN